MSQKIKLSIQQAKLTKVKVIKEQNICKEIKQTNLGDYNEHLLLNSNLKNKATVESVINYMTVDQVCLTP